MVREQAEINIPAIRIHIQSMEWASSSIVSVTSGVVPDVVDMLLVLVLPRDYSSQLNHNVDRKQKYCVFLSAVLWVLGLFCRGRGPQFHVTVKPHT